MLSLVGKAVGADTGTVWVHDFADSSASFDGSGANIASFIGFEESSLASYASHYSRVNVRTAREDSLPSCSAVTSAMLYPNHELKRTEFYGDWLRKSDLFHALGSVVEREQSRAVKMSFLRSERAGEFDTVQFRLMQALMPHIRTAVHIHRKMHSAQAVADAAFMALDALNFGVVLLSGQGSFIHWNETARDTARRSGALTTGATGQLLCPTAALTAQLAAAVRHAIAAGQGRGTHAGTMLSLPGRNKERVQIFACPMPSTSSRFGPGVGAMLFVKDPSRATPGLAASLRSIYKMTAAEAALTEALTDGKSLKTFAEERGVTLNTAKSQLKHVVMKVGVKRQVDVVREILTGLAVLQVRAGQSDGFS